MKCFPHNQSSIDTPGLSVSHQAVIPAAISDDMGLTIYDWSKVDFSAICFELNSINWQDLFGHCFHVDDIWNGFKTVVWSSIDTHVPKKSVHHSKKYKPRQYPKYIKRLLSKKSIIWRTWKLSKQPETKEEYTKIANECRLAIHKFDIEREQKLLEANNLGAFYRFVNSKLSSRSGIAPLSTDGSQLFTSDSDKANLLNDFFKSAFTTDDGTIRVGLACQTGPGNLV